jgi:SAM-dependent methyltransferase
MLRPFYADAARAVNVCRVRLEAPIDGRARGRNQAYCERGGTRAAGETMLRDPLPAMRSGGAASPQDLVNWRIYHDRRIHRYYRSRSLDCAETMALLKYQPAFVGRRVLDFGIGTGRTTRYLAPLASAYLGIDYSPRMIEYVRTVMPGVVVQLADIRDLSGLAVASFDCVLASGNLIDAVSHADRLRVFTEVRRILDPDGRWIFSSHNRNYRYSGSHPRLPRSRNPVTQTVFAAQYLRSWINHARVGRFRRLEPDYALLNDTGHEYAALHYYIDRHAQERQLARTGFAVLDIFDASGRALRPGDDDSDSATLLYVARPD